MSLINRQSGLVVSLSYGAANILGSALSAIALILFSRVLGPIGFGAFSVAFSLTQLVSRLGDAGIGVSLLRYVAGVYKSDPKKAAAALYFSAQIKLIIALIAVIIGVFFGATIGREWLNLSDPRFATIGITLAAVIIFYEFAVLAFQSIQKFTQAALLNAVQAGLKLAVAVVLLTWFTPDAYLGYILYGIAPIAAIILGWMLFPSAYQRLIAIPAEVKKALLHTAKYTAVATIALAVADHYDILMVQSMLTEFETGIYSAASRITLIFIMFGFSAGTVLNARVAGYKKLADMKNYFNKALLAALGCLALTPLLLLFASPLVMLASGPAYIPAIPALRLLLIATTITLATVPFIALFYTLDHPKYFLISGLLQIIVLIGGNALLIPALGIEGSAMAKIIMRTIVLLYTVFTAWMLIRKKQSATFSVRLQHSLEKIITR